MEVIITESQLSLLLEKESNVYTDKTLYDKALKKYNRIWKAYNQSQNIYDYYKNNEVLIPSSMKITSSNYDSMVKYLYDLEKKTTNRTLSIGEINKILKSNNILPKFTYNFILTTPNTSDKHFKKVEGRGSGSNCKWPKMSSDSPTKPANLYIGYCGYVYNMPNIPKPIYQPNSPLPAKSFDVPKTTTKTSPVVNYKELKAQATFAPQYKTGTPIVQVGTYYMTYPEFEEYKKSRPNTKFNKL
jgi:hypothetical protein